MTDSQKTQFAKEIKEGMGWITFDYISESWERRFNEAILFTEQIQIAAYLIEEGIQVQNG